jgi:hypothetical protein
MTIIVSVGSPPHIREIESNPRKACLPFHFIHPDPYNPNENNHTTSIDADFLKKMPFGVSRFAKKIYGSYLPSKIGKIC